MDIEKLHRFATNSVLDEHELEETICWIEASPENQKEFSRIKNLCTYTGFAKDMRSIPDVNTFTRKAKSERIIPATILKYAAIFILAFIIGGLSITFLGTPKSENAFNEVIVPFGESAEIILSDNTHVWLNSGAKLKYPSQFLSDQRVVQLEGEAYFEVESNENRQFKVITPKLNINVLGTSFNVAAFEDSRLVNVALVEGKVNLENKQGSLLATMAPRELASYDITSNKLEISKVNTAFYTSWKEGTINFKDERLEEIAKKLERWFNVQVVFDHESVKQMKFTGSVLKNKPIEQILEILKYTSGIDYSIDIKSDEKNIIRLKKVPMN